ncbi:hypothetical protein HN51_061129 [Arachis hypogaea]|uniref:uncharacterized protein n=1 Tax=Arachis hypogaea TaxID=3818 RepID=UPI0007AF06FC|nr:uncharacterized protein LOC107634798 isoform X2 [Arachis ipaensis]XP_025626303.1 uncharacterized protein LOC112719807 [Arachis hypogaea]QHO18311.1 uncharacterized protein DS421_11g319400 [Arachis hypogaea]
MGSESRNGDGYGGGEAALPAAVKKVVQSVKEILNFCSEQEIYAVLRECDMDPNRAVERLLAQDTFHEVRSKRERRKEGKEALDSRTRGSNGGLGRAGKTGNGSDRSVTNNELTHLNYNGHVKPVNKEDVGSIGTSVTSSTNHVVGRGSRSDSFSADTGSSSLGTSDSISVFAQVSSGLQTSLLGVSKAHLTMADIVRMGRTSQNVSHDDCTASGVSASGNSETMLNLDSQSHSEQQPFHDKWHVNEQPTTSSSQAPTVFASLNANGPSKQSSLCDTVVSVCGNSELDSSQGAWGDCASDDVMCSKTKLESHSNSNSKDTCSSDLHHSQGHEDVLLAASDFKGLSIRESKVEMPLSGDNPTVVLPNDVHLQALADTCSHLSFGKFNASSNTASSVIPTPNLPRNGLEEKSAAIDSSLVQFSDASSVQHGGKQLEFEAVRGSTGDKNDNFLSSPQQELLKHIIPEETFGHEYNVVASVSDPNWQNSRWVTPSLPLKQPGLQSGSHYNFPREMLDESNSSPGDMFTFIGSQSQPGGYNSSLLSTSNNGNSISGLNESNLIPGDMLALLRSEQPVRYNSSVLSLSNTPNSISDVMEPGMFDLPKRSALSHDPTVQSSVQFQQFPNMEGYSSLPRDQSYITAINSQQPFSGNPRYNQSALDMKYNLHQDRNELLMNRLPPAAARETYGYGNHGSSFYGPRNVLPNSSLGYTMPQSNLDDILPSQYGNGGRNISSIQQNGSLSQQDYGAAPRASFRTERTEYNFMRQQQQQQNLAPVSQYVNPGYSDPYHSQKQVAEELQQAGGLQGLSPQQLQQLWRYIH